MPMKSQGRVAASHVETARPASGSHTFDLFVVHAGADANFVRGYLLPALNLPSSRVLLLDALTPGAPVISEIARGVSRSRFTIAVLSPAYLEDRWAVFGEQLASHLSIEDAHIIPLLLTDCRVPLQLESRVALDFTDRRSWDDQAERLRKLLYTTAPTDEQIPCPYPGRRPFTAHETGWFFGRDKEIDELIGRLDRGEREIYVMGPSGSGKSSLLEAGLLPALATGSSRLGRSFAVCAMRPGSRPIDRLAKALEVDLATPGAMTPEPSTSGTMIDAFLTRHLPAERVLVVIDQLEELFTLTDATERQRFIAMLHVLRAEPRCYLLLALRTDFLETFMTSELGPAHTGIPRLDLQPLRGAALMEAITAPALQVGVHLEVRLCDRLVADAAAEPGSLAHVQETLRLLWDKRHQRLLRLAEYEALGDGGSGLHITIARHAEATLRSLTVAQQTIARRVLLRLVSFGEGRADTRRQQEAQALRSAGDDDAEFSRVLQRLLDERLVTADATERADGVLVDLSHEALITAWPSFRAWVSQRRSHELQRRRLEAKAGEWIERGRGATSLLDAVELAEAIDWMQSNAARELGYGADLLDFVAASQALLRDERPLHVLPRAAAARTDASDGPPPARLLRRPPRNLPGVTFRAIRRFCRSRRWLRT
jgi:TIR domain/NACHT domain